MSNSTGLLPAQSSLEYDPDPVRIPLRNRDYVFDALTSASARAILSILAEDPKPASAVAETVGMSTQNVLYHINSLQSADLVKVVDTWYSKKGREMDIYAARYDTLVLTLAESTDQTILSDDFEMLD